MSLCSARTQFTTKLRHYVLCYVIVVEVLLTKLLPVAAYCSDSEKVIVKEPIVPFVRVGIITGIEVLYIGMVEVFYHYGCTFENSDLHFYFQ